MTQRGRSQTGATSAIRVDNVDEYPMSIDEAYRSRDLVGIERWRGSNAKGAMVELLVGASAWACRESVTEHARIPASMSVCRFITAGCSFRRD